MTRKKLFIPLLCVMTTSPCAITCSMNILANNTNNNRNMSNIKKTTLDDRYHNYQKLSDNVIFKSTYKYIQGKSSCYYDDTGLIFTAVSKIKELKDEGAKNIIIFQHN